MANFGAPKALTPKNRVASSFITAGVAAALVGSGLLFGKCSSNNTVQTGNGQSAPTPTPGVFNNPNLKNRPELSRPETIDATRAAQEFSNRVQISPIASPSASGPSASPPSPAP